MKHGSKSKVNKIESTDNFDNVTGAIAGASSTNLHGVVDDSLNSNKNSCHDEMYKLAINQKRFEKQVSK